MMGYNKIVIMIMMLGISANSYGYHYPTGFLWYNKAVNEKDTKDKQLSKEGKPDSKALKPWDQNIEALKHKFEEAQRKALDNPTLANVIAVQRIQKEIMAKSSKFAIMWQLATLMDYGLFSQDSPNSSLHKKLYDVKQEQQNITRIKQIAKDFGLVIQVSTKCQYCHSLAKIVKEFARQFGFQLLAVSTEGDDFLGILGARDNGIFASLNLNPEMVVPVLYLMSKSGRKIYPVARGVVNQQQIIENIIMLDKYYQRLAA
jgi:conjugal transfer pilus assembly protein TraF